MATVLGVALGPDATVVEARASDDGELISAAVVRHVDAGTDPDDPTTWWRSLTMAIARTGARQVAAMAVTGSHPGLVLLDEAGVVLRPVQAWEGASAEVARLRQALGPARWARRAGTIPGATTAITRLAWLRRTDPAAFRRIGTVLLPHDWLTYRLAGRPVTDRGTASCTGMWSPGSESWLGEAIELLVGPRHVEEWAGRLPEVLDADAPADWLDAPMFEPLGLRSRPLVASGTAEPMAIALALGLTPGRVAVALGEATTALSPLDAPLVEPTGAVDSRADATGGHLAVAATPGGASFIAALARFADLDVADLGHAALDAEAPPPEDHLVVLPGVEGRPGAVITGLGSGTGRATLARAAFEGVASSAVASLEAITEAGGRWYEHEPVHLSGPVEGLDAHAAVLARLSGRRVVVCAGATPAAGACIQAAAVLGRFHPGEVAEGWALADGDEVDPEDDPDREHRLALHAEERDRQRRASDD